MDANEIKRNLLKSLLSADYSAVAKRLGISKAEVSRKASGINGIAIEQLCEWLSLTGGDFIPDTDNYKVITNSEYEFLRSLAKRHYEGTQ